MTTTYDKGKNTRIDALERVREQAEMRAQTAVAEAMARAENAAAQAEARAKQRIAEQHRRMQDLARRRYEMVSAFGDSSVEDLSAAATDETLRLRVDPEPSREAVAVRAYYRSQQRGFGPGHETEDWLQAERELLNIDP